MLEMLKSSARSSRVRVQTLATLVLLAASLSSCTDGVDLATPVADGHARIPLAAYYAGANASAAADVNRIRITITTDPGGQRFGPFVFDVDPNATEWNLPVEFALATPTDVIVLAELINVTNSTETVEYSGRIGPFRVTPGPTPSTPPAPIQVFRGPPENLNITAIRVTGAAPVIEGGSIQLTAAVDGGGPNTQVFWTALDPTLATVSPTTGLVQTLLPGTARIVATAGPRSDEARINISRRMARVELTPASRTASSLGETADFTARVLDPRNAEFTGVALTWAAADPNIAEHLGNGRFRAKTRGRTAITATVEGTPTLRASGEFIVEQRLARVDVSPVSRTLDAPGLTGAFSAVGKDAGGTIMEGVAFRWSAVNTAIATVDQAGLATGRAVGSTAIRAEADGITGSGQLEVRQQVARIEVAPAEFTFTAINERTRFTATVRDANSNVMARTVTWRSNTPSTASVDEQSGEVNANSRGSTTIVATVDGVSGSARVIVTPAVSRITFNTLAISLTGPGQTFQLQASVRDANNFLVPGKTVTYYSQTPGVATVSATGLVTGVAAGNGRIAATVDGFVATVPVTVAAVVTAPPPYLAIVPGSPTSVGNCIPFGTTQSYGFTGFIYRNLPAFTLRVGDKIAFDLGQMNDVDLHRRIYLAAANQNPAPAEGGNDVVSQGIRAVAWTKVVEASQIPTNPRGNNLSGDYELVYTAEAQFSFPGGGLIIGFMGSSEFPDGGCEQVLVSTTSNDESGSFYARFFSRAEATLDVIDTPGGGNAVAIGGVKIYAAGTSAPRVIVDRTSILKPAASVPEHLMYPSDRWVAGSAADAARRSSVVKKKN